MTNNAERLSKKTLAVLDASDKERIDFIRMGSWIDIGQSKTLISLMTELLESPRVKRPKCLLIVGEPNSGKSWALDRFYELHLPNSDPESSQATSPVVKIESPDGPDKNALYSRILDALFADYRPASKPEQKRAQVLRLFKSLGTRILLMDEIHNISAGTTALQGQYLIALKGLTNEAKVNLVASGIDVARTVFVQDQQFTSRFGRPFELLKWSVGLELGTLLKTLESRIPLKNPSGLLSEDFQFEVIRRTRGNFGDICDLVKEAAVSAIRDPSKPEFISLDRIKKLDWISPSDTMGFARGARSNTIIVD